MNYGSIKIADCANGPGMRTSLFVSGCTNRCPGCFNEVTWDFDYGLKFTNETIRLLLATLDNPSIAGLSILGGEPLDIRNQAEVIKLIESVRFVFGDSKDIWLYTGYTWEKIPRFEDTDDALRKVDVVVDGPFIEEQKDITLTFRGSKNQRIIDVQKTFKEGHVVLWEI